VERRRPVQEDWVLLDDLLERVPHLVRRRLDELLRRLIVVVIPFCSSRL